MGKKHKKRAKARRATVVVKVASPPATNPAVLIAEVVAAQAVYGALVHLANERRRPRSLLGVAARHPGAAFDVAVLRAREGVQKLKAGCARWRASLAATEDESRPPEYPRLPSR